MSGISPLTISLIIWGLVTAIFAVLMMYRSLVTMREDDQLFLNSNDSKAAEEQREVQHRISTITPYTKGFGYASAGLAMVSAGLWVYQSMTRVYGP
jgi:hypothetical protein